MKKTWTGTIKYPKSGGGDTVYTISQDYYVVEPDIQVSSAAAFSLYKDCGNKLSFQVPALGSEYNPSITVQGANVRRTSNKGEVIIIPNSPEVRVNVSSGGIPLGVKKYKVKLMPKPEILVKCNNRLVDLVKGVSTGDLRKVEVVVVPDNGFRASNPTDCRYRAVYWKASLVRNGRIKGLPKVVRQGVGNLRSLQAQSGDRIIVEEIKIKRRNFENRVLDVDVGTKVFVIPVQ